MREALRAAVDAPLTSLPDHKDGDWVTAGGIITQAKKIRTKKGDPMMFATLDDLEGAIEVLIFGKALAEYEGALGVDEVVLVRGRVDHGDKGTSLIAQTVDPFRPSVEEVEAAREAAALEPQGPQALTVSVDATALPATIIEELKHILGNHAGESEVVLAIQTSAGPRTLRLGEGYRVNETPSLRAELGRILGPARAPSRLAPLLVRRKGLNDGLGPSPFGWACPRKDVEDRAFSYAEARDPSHVGGPCPLPSRERPLALPLDRGRGVAFFARARWCTTARCWTGGGGPQTLVYPQILRPNGAGACPDCEGAGSA